MTTPNIPAVENAEVLITQGFASAAHAFVYANRPDTTGGLARGYYGGRWGGFNTSDSAHTFTASTTTYVSVSRASGALDYSTSNTNYNDSANYARVETVVTDGTGVTTVTDDRGGPGGVHGGGAGGSAAVKVLPLACSDESSALTTGTAKFTFRMPHAMTLTAVRASVGTAPTGSSIIVDINEGGSSILSTKLSIDASEKTSTTAASAAVISDAALADDAEITIDIDQVGSTVAGAGLKVYLIGT